ncbi:uncharacterized protein LOC133193902 [Saccostrea echinata]|uniref:uncharacterized protein LOC133193902 n=1 Tax=Saccostrea echinata TaxID=191078 RepID=UPI002A83189F|nr:uncharacterized protein LOC133193902 [Saccostrea echinata]
MANSIHPAPSPKYFNRQTESRSTRNFSTNSSESFQQFMQKNISESSSRRIVKHWKMILIILIPVLSLMTLTTANLLKASEVKRATVNGIENVQEAYLYAQLVKMLQRERGISSTYLSSTGNKSAAFNKMISDRRNTDLAFADIPVNQRTVFVSDIPFTMLQLHKNVNLSRERINNGSISVEDHLDFYTNLNEGLVNVMFKGVDIPGEQNYYGEIVAFSSLVRWTDIIGLLRARIAFQYATCAFTSKTMQNYMFLTGKAVAYKNIFILYTMSLKDAFSKQNQSTEDYLDEVRIFAWSESFMNSCQSFTKEHRLSLGLVWFQNITKFIDFAFEIQIRHSNILTSIMSQIRKDAEFQFSLYISVQIIITIVSFVLTTWYLVCIEKLTFKIAKHASTIKAKSNELAAEKKLTDRLLYQMLPKNIAKTLKECRDVNAEYFEEVTIFFSDIVDFTELGSRSSPMQIIDLLNDLYGLFDDHTEKYDIYKVETIGDAYMVASGVPIPNGNTHAVHICKLALDLHELMRRYRVPISFERDENVKIRMGIHSGPCVAGVVGRKMPRYCLFGDTVNTASRMESTGIGGKIHLSPDTYSIIKPLGCFVVSLRGRIVIKGKGEMKTYWLESFIQTPQVTIFEPSCI